MAAGFGIYTSNRLEVLAERLAEEMATAPLGPFQRDIVVVQSLGTARWTTLELARRLGVVGGCRRHFRRLSRNGCAGGCSTARR